MLKNRGEARERGLGYDWVYNMTELHFKMFHVCIIQHVTGSEKTRHIVNSMKFELAIPLNSSTTELTFLQV